MYKSFLGRFNVNLIFFLNYSDFVKHFNVFSKLNTPIISLVPINIKPIYIDYYLIINKYYSKNLIFVFFNLILNIYFFNLKLNFFKNRYTFFSFFNSLKKI